MSGVLGREPYEDPGLDVSPRTKRMCEIDRDRLAVRLRGCVQHIKELEKENKKLTEYANEEREIMSKVIDGMKQEIKKLGEEKSEMKEALAEKFYKHYDDMGYNKLNIARTVGPDLGRMVDHLINENKKLQEENKELQEEIKHLEDRAVADYDTRMKENKKQLEKMKELEMKGNARKDIIKNMFECITADLEEVEDGGFYIKRDWGHKYIDTWNEIVTQEYKDALKDINEQLEGIEWETDGYQFDFNIVDESEEEEESEDE